ncbi:MAG: hypothetical protein IJA49_07730 [Oscillospiraceae bacterium]|nr:hypothetical protein [Oscillospiraceae bacterium]
MKRFHCPTLIMHILLILFAALALNDYPDLFLGVSLFVLLVHIAWVIERKSRCLTAHSLGIVLHILVQHLELVRVDNGAFGLGGGFALFFFNIALAVSFAVISLIGIIRFCRAN